jgi:hypothetical protein
VTDNGWMGMGVFTFFLRNPQGDWPRLFSIPICEVSDRALDSISFHLLRHLYYHLLIPHVNHRALILKIYLDHLAFPYPAVIV